MPTSYVYCAACGRPLDHEPVETPPQGREPCIYCGSVNRHIGPVGDDPAGDSPAP